MAMISSSLVKRMKDFLCFFTVPNLLVYSLACIKLLVSTRLQRENIEPVKFRRSLVRVLSIIYTSAVTIRMNH